MLVLSDPIDWVALPEAFTFANSVKIYTERSFSIDW